MFFLRYLLVTFSLLAGGCFYVASHQDRFSPEVDHTLLWVLSGLGCVAAALVMAAIMEEHEERQMIASGQLPPDHNKLKENEVV